MKALVGRAPRAVTADRGYGAGRRRAGPSGPRGETVVIPRNGRKPGRRAELESSRSLPALVKWRTGSEGRISHLKHGWGFDRSVLDGIEGATTWCAWGVLVHNTAKIAVLSEEKERGVTERTQQRPCIEPIAAGPPTGRSPTPELPTNPVLVPGFTRRPVARDGGGAGRVEAQRDEDRGLTARYDWLLAEGSSPTRRFSCRSS